MYVLWTSNIEVMNKIKRSYKDFVEMATYRKKNKVIARQYKVKADRKRSAYHLAKE